MIFQDNEGLYKISGYPTWIHSDIMDDNVYMELSSSAHNFDKPTSHASSTPSDVLEFCNGDEKQRRWHPTYILDYSDLSIGEWLTCLILGISFCFYYFILLMGCYMSIS